jgi:hypothetical protein
VPSKLLVVVVEPTMLGLVAVFGDESASHLGMQRSGSRVGRGGGESEGVPSKVVLARKWLMMMMIEGIVIALLVKLGSVPERSAAVVVSLALVLVLLCVRLVLSEKTVRRSLRRRHIV